MSNHCSRLMAVVFVLSTVSSYGCESGNGWQEDRFGGIRPSQIGFNGLAEATTNSVDFFAHGVTLQPAIVTPQVVTSAVCPTRRAIQAPIEVVAVADADSDLILNQVDARFVNRNGVFVGSKTFAQRDLVDIFGSTLIPRAATRSFPLILPFGCTSDFSGTLAIAVFTGNSFGRTNTRTFTVVVR